MLLKFTKTNGAASSSSTSTSSMTGTYIARGTGMRTTMSTMSTMSPRIHRKGFRTPSKRHPGKAFPGKLHSVSRIGPGKIVPGKRFPIRPHPPPCDNSNDSGFGFDQHVEIQQQQQQLGQHQQQQQANSSTNISNISSPSSSLHNHQSSHYQQQNCIQNSSLNSGSLSATSTSTSTSTSSSSSSSLSSSSSSSPPSISHQQSPQHNLIRAIPTSRSRPAKKLPFLNDDTENTESEDEDFCTDDSDDNYGGRHRKNLKMSNQQLSSFSSSSSSSCSSSATSSHSDNHHHNQNSNHHHHHHVGHGIKRKKIETMPVDLDNDDACSEDAFIRKIASAASANLPIESITATTTAANMSANATRSTQLVVQAQGQAQAHPHPHPHPHPQPQSQSQSQPQSHLHSSPGAGSAATKFIIANARGMTRVALKRQPVTPPNSIATSSNGRIQLEIVSQPEQQHRARYQTEGSRGAVKDRSGNGFPIVRLVGYNKAAALQVFIGTDIGRVAPHMFYQACKVAGKNSTQCSEKKVDGTVVIEIDFKPELDMTITCDCVGILKERNVDVEHRFPEHLAQKNKKKSTRCRMVFRTQLTHDDGTVETLQVCSNPIICTQPPGVPEICKKSLNSCPVDGGLELFIIGKNFLKDTHVLFQETYESLNDNADASDDDLKTAAGITNDVSIIGGALWEQTVLPDKEYLQQTHLVCTVPPFIHQNILKPVAVQLSIVSSGKKSESHTFVYTPKGTYTPLAAATTLSSTNSMHSSLSSSQDGSFMDTSSAVGVAAAPTALWPNSETKHEIDADMMPPPITTQMPMIVRRPSLNTSQPLISDQQLVHLNAVVAAEALKTELLDESSQNSMADAIHSPETVVAACGVGGPQSPTALQYHSRYGRKSSMDAIIYDNNSMQGFPVATATATTTPMEVAVAAAVEMAVKNEIAKAVSVAKVDKFITDLAKSTNVTDATDSTQESSLFGVPSTAAIDHALTDILATPQTSAAAAAAAAAAAVVLERSLSNSSAGSSVATGSPLAGTSPSNTLTNHNSPITQDIILNSEPSVQLTPSMPLQQLLPAGTAASVNVVNPEVSQAAGLSTDIIMNPSVSPSTILCSDNGAATAVVPNIMAPHQVTMANSILNDIAMHAQPTQQDAAVAALALSNIIMTSPNDSAVTVPPSPDSMQPEVTTATSTAVSNMIIKAAADFISNQEQQTQHHHHCHTHTAHTPQQQIMTPQNVATDPLSCNPLKLLLNHSDVGTATKTGVAATNVVVNDAVPSQYPTLSMTTPPQESLIVALATENVLQKSVAAAAITSNGAVVTQETSAPPTQNLHPAAAVAVGAVAAAAAAAAVAPLAPIPQDLTTMSDQDLLSYINPSTFDQV